jgi:hypothetical protein
MRKFVFLWRDLSRWWWARTWRARHVISSRERWLLVTVARVLCGSEARSAVARAADARRRVLHFRQDVTPKGARHRHGNL